MVLKRHLGVFSMLLPQGPNTVSSFGDFAMKWMFGNGPSGFPRYIHDVTAGMIDISGAELFGTAVVQDQAIHSQITNTTNRGAALAAAAKVARGMAGDLRRFDGLVFIVLGQAVDAGASELIEEGERINAAIFDDRGSHTFMCHEIAHVVGFEHSYQLSWYNSKYMYGEYGDPSDIMSAESFGGNAGVFILPFDPSADITSNAKFWQLAGPGMSPATLWRYLPGFPTVPEWVHALPANAPPTAVRLKPAGRFGTTLAIMPREAGGWWAVEYRPAIDWDRGLKYNPFNTTNAPGIVVHEILDVGHGYEHPSFPRYKRVCYRKTIPYPTSGDNDWNDTGIGVRIINATLNEAEVLIGATLPNVRSIQSTSEVHESEVVRWSAGRVFVQLAGPRCEGAFLDVERILKKQELVLNISGTGFYDSRYSFSIDGHVLTSPRPASSVAISDILPLLVKTWIPVDKDTAIQKNRLVPLQWTQTGNSLTVVIPAGVGRFSLNIIGAIEDNTGHKLLANNAFDVETEVIEFSNSAIAAIEACLRHLITQLDVQHILPRRVPKPPGSGEEPDWANLSGRELVLYLAHLHALNETSAFVARGLSTRIAASIGSRTLAHFMTSFARALTSLSSNSES